MSHLSAEEKQLVATLEENFRIAKEPTNLLNTEYPMVVEFGGRKRCMTAWRKVTLGNLYIKVLFTSQLGPYFQVYSVSRKTGIKLHGEINLFARTPEVLDELLREFTDKFPGHFNGDAVSGAAEGQAA